MKTKHSVTCVQLYFIQYYVLHCIDPALKINVSKRFFCICRLCRSYILSSKTKKAVTFYHQVLISMWATREAVGLLHFAMLVARLATFHDVLNLTPAQSQRGFQKERRSIDMVFTARHLQEKCQEQNADLFSTRPCKSNQGLRHCQW